MIPRSVDQMKGYPYDSGKERLRKTLGKIIQKTSEVNGLSINMIQS